VHGSNARNLSVKLSLPQTSKNAVCLLCFLFSKTREQEGRTVSSLNVAGREGKGGQTMNTRVSKCKNDKRKKKKKFTVLFEKEDGGLFTWSIR
jgi:hypothetical protein